MEILNKLLDFRDREFEAWEIGSDNRDLIKLMKLGVVEIVLKTNKHTIWRVKDIAKIERLIKLRETKIQIPAKEPLFSSIEGHEKHKEIILRAVNCSEPIHLLLCGAPASAKTLFLLELTKIGGEYVTPYITYVGMFDLLLTNPKILLIDQLDNVKDKGVYRLLIDLCEYGYVTKTTHYELMRDKVDTKIIATANSVKRIPEALLSRFLILRFREYSDSEYVNVANKVLSNFNIDSKLKEYIIKRTLPFKDVRNAIKLAKICKSTKDVDDFMDVIVLR
jgi:hypothetical protein